MDVVPLHTVTRAMTGGVAFAVGKTLDVNPRVQLGKLPVKVPLPRLFPLLAPSRFPSFGSRGHPLSCPAACAPRLGAPR